MPPIACTVSWTDNRLIRQVTSFMKYDIDTWAGVHARTGDARQVVAREDGTRVLVQLIDQPPSGCAAQC
jgi:hypothetical protein